MTRSERIEGIDPTIGSERSLTVDQLSSQSNWRAMRLQGRVAVPGLDIVQDQAQGVPEGPTSFVFCLASDEKKTVPDKLKKIVDALDADDFEKRQTASKDLAKNATLKELVDLKEVPGLSLEQKDRIEKVTKETVENVWKAFQEDPRKNKLDSSDGNVNEALFKYAPLGTFDIRGTTEKIREFLYQRGARTVKEYNDHIKESERISALVDWVAAAARQEGASANLKATAGYFWFDGAYARSLRMRAHADLEEGDPKVVSDAGKMTKEERNFHAKAARTIFMDDVRNSPYALANLEFRDYLGRYLNDKSVPSAEYARTIETLTKKATSGRFDTVLYQDDRVALMRRLMALKDLPEEKAKTVGRQVENLSQDLESRIKKIKDPADRIFCEESMIFSYYHGNQMAKGRQMYLQSLETAKLLPEEERRRKIEHIKTKWGEHFDKK